MHQIDHIATHCNTLQLTATLVQKKRAEAAMHQNTSYCNAWQRAAIDCNRLKHNNLQHTVTNCNTLQHTATHGNTRSEN